MIATAGTTSMLLLLLASSVVCIFTQSLFFGMTDAFTFLPITHHRIGGVRTTAPLVTSSSSTSTARTAYPPRKRRGGGGGGKGNNSNKKEEEERGGGDDYDPIMDEPQGRRGDGRNWIEKSSPTGIGKLVESEASESSSSNEETDGNYDLGINGQSFQTGDLSKRMYDAMMNMALQRFPPGTTELPSELEDVYKSFAMDATAKEAVKAALEQNGLEPAPLPGQKEAIAEGEEEAWGEVDSVQLFDLETNQLENNGNEIYDSLQGAVEEGDWVPGQTFNFVVRNVPAKLKEMDVEDLLKALDPDGVYRSEAKEKGVVLPDEDIGSLRELGKDCERRGNIAPRETEGEDTVFRGDGSKGYNVINRSDLLKESGNTDGTESHGTIMHVMDALVNHGCIIVDITDGGTSYRDAIKITKMWQTTKDLFTTLANDNNAVQSLPKMGTMNEIGSPNAVVGYSNYGDGNMQFLETRIQRTENGVDGQLKPVEIENILGEDGVSSMKDSFDCMCQIGKDVVRVAVAAASIEYDAFYYDNDNVDTSGDNEEEEESSDLPFISGLTFEEAEISGIALNSDEDEEVDNDLRAEQLASEKAALMADELIDDGISQVDNVDQTTINMSPQRICSYSSKKEDSSGDDSKLKETFGAHTDTSFVTIVPVAEVSGLEVFDEAADKWFRPELCARKAWEKEQEERGLDPSAQTEKVLLVNEDGEEEEVEIPWHARYVALMPGELLQICARNEIAAALHRVVTVNNGASRLSAPVLLRPRVGMKMDVEKYFGRQDKACPLLLGCDGMKMEEIHDALQPSSYR